MSARHPHVAGPPVDHRSREPPTAPRLHKAGPLSPGQDGGCCRSLGAAKRLVRWRADEPWSLGRRAPLCGTAGDRAWRRAATMTPAPAIPSASSSTTTLTSLRTMAPRIPGLGDFPILSRMTPTRATRSVLWPLARSIYNPITGTSIQNPRQQINVITSYLNMSQIYGSSQAVADAVRGLLGGLLKTSHGNMLPYNSLDYFTQDQLNALAMQNEGPLPTTHCSRRVTHAATRTRK